MRMVNQEQISLLLSNSEEGKQVSEVDGQAEAYERIHLAMPPKVFL